jgi:DNA-binding MarR family transcriptional regulator
MSGTCDNYFECCLYFTTNTMARTISKMADDIFMSTGLSPAFAFMQMTINENPGISQSVLAQKLQLAPSTVTRFLDKLIAKGLIEKTVQGRNASLFPTEEGLSLHPLLREAWRQLYEVYSGFLGEEFAVKLTADMAKANEILPK